MEDNDLILASAAGDRRAFSRLMERHADFALALAARVSGNDGDADEVVQEAFIRVWRMAPQWDPSKGASFRTWLYRVVLNLCLDRSRRASFLTLDEAPEPVDHAPHGADHLTLSRIGPVVRQLLQSLPERQRAAMALCYLEDMSAAMAAEIMDVSLSAMEALLVRARRTLREELARKGLDKLEDLI